MARATRSPDEMAFNLDLHVIWQQEALSGKSGGVASDDLTYVSLTRGTFGATLTAASVDEKAQLIARRDACEERVGRLIVDRQTNLLEFATRLATALLKTEFAKAPSGRKGSYADWLAGPRDRRFFGRDADNIAGLIVAARSARAAVEDRIDVYRTDACSFYEAVVQCMPPTTTLEERPMLASQLMPELILVGASVSLLSMLSAAAYEQQTIWREIVLTLDELEEPRLSDNARRLTKVMRLYEPTSATGLTLRSHDAIVIFPHKALQLAVRPLQKPNASDATKSDPFKVHSSAKRRR